MSHFNKLERPSLWRRLARASWDAPTQSIIYGQFEVDMTRALAFLARAQETSGQKVTITHLVTRAVALALREYPLMNGVIRWNGFFLRKTIDVSILVARDHAQLNEGGGLTSVKITRADERSLVEIARMTQGRARQAVAHEDPELAPTEGILGRLPDFVLRPMLRAIDVLSFELDMDLRWLGLPYDAFGSAVITNLGTLGLPTGFPPLFPPSHCPLVIAVGEVEDAPMAVAGQVAVRPRLTLTCTADHRIVDGLGAAKMVPRFREIMMDPGRHLDGDLPAARAARPARPARSVLRVGGGRGARGVRGRRGARGGRGGNGGRDGRREPAAGSRERRRGGRSARQASGGGRLEARDVAR